MILKVDKAYAVITFLSKYFLFVKSFWEVIWADNLRVGFMITSFKAMKILNIKELICLKAELPVLFIVNSVLLIFSCTVLWFLGCTRAREHLFSEFHYSVLKMVEVLYLWL